MLMMKLIVIKWNVPVQEFKVGDHAEKLTDLISSVIQLMTDAYVRSALERSAYCEYDEFKVGVSNIAAGEVYYKIDIRRHIAYVIYRKRNEEPPIFNIRLLLALRYIFLIISR